MFYYDRSAGAFGINKYFCEICVRSTHISEKYVYSEAKAGGLV